MASYKMQLAGKGQPIENRFLLWPFRLPAAVRQVKPHHHDHDHHDHHRHDQTLA